MPPFNVYLVSDRDEALVAPGDVASLDGDLEGAWLPVRCQACSSTVLVRGHQRGRADVDMTATFHRGECGCGQAVEVTMEWLQDGYRTWQPLANPDVDGGEPLLVDDLADRVREQA